MKPGCNLMLPAPSVMEPTPGGARTRGVHIERHLRWRRHVNADEGLLIDGNLAREVEEGPDLLGSRGDLGAVIVTENHRNAHADHDPANGNDHQQLD